MDEQHRQNVSFIETDLVPEMVYNRCFCDPGSREFVEFDSIVVQPVLPSDSSESSELYTAEVVVRYSGEPKTHSILIKLPTSRTDVRYIEEDFQNEELFYSKMVKLFRSNHFPKCYAADMGRYGKPVIVLEDLRSQGYRRVSGKLDEEHLKLCVGAIGQIHGTGLRLKRDSFREFRELYAKFQETTFTVETDAVSWKGHRETVSRVLDYLKSQTNPDLEFLRNLKEALEEEPYEIMRKMASQVNELSTICHGDFTGKRLLFKYENGKPVDVKVTDWQKIRYCSIGVDLSVVLLANLDVHERVARTERVLKVYFEAVKNEYPSISEEELRQEFVSKLLHAFNILALGLLGSESSKLEIDDIESNSREARVKGLAEVLSDLKTLGLFN